MGWNAIDVSIDHHHRHHHSTPTQQYNPPQFWYSWRNQLEALGAAHHCIAVDLRGYGWSDKPPAVSDYVIEKLVGDVKGLVHALGYGEQGVVLVGHDWGGNIAWYAAHMLGPALIKVSVGGAVWCGVCKGPTRQHVNYSRLTDEPIDPSTHQRLVVCNCPHPLAFLENGTFKQLMRSWYFYVWQWCVQRWINWWFDRSIGRLAHPLHQPTEPNYNTNIKPTQTAVPGSPS